MDEKGVDGGDNINMALERHSADLKGHWWFHVKLALDLARALDALHSQEVVHGAVQSSHVLINRDWCCKLAGYGFIQDNSLSRAPELFQRHNGSMAADIYGFGVVLAEIMLHTKLDQLLPCSGEGQCLVAADVSRLLDNEGDCPASAIQLCLQCIDPNPEMRPTAEEVVDWLQDLYDELKGEEDLQGFVKSLPAKLVIKTDDLGPNEYTSDSNISPCSQPVESPSHGLQIKTPSKRDASPRLRANRTPPAKPRILNPEMTDSEESTFDFSGFTDRPITPERSFSVLSPEMHGISQCKHRGYILKRNHKGLFYKRYRKYWFVLRSHCLEWFEDGEAENLSEGTIKLESCSLCKGDEQFGRWNWRLLVPNKGCSFERRRSLLAPSKNFLSPSLSTQRSTSPVLRRANSWNTRNSSETVMPSKSELFGFGRAESDSSMTGAFCIYEFASESAEERGAWMAAIQVEIDEAGRHSRRLSSPTKSFLFQSVSDIMSSNVLSEEKGTDGIKEWLNKIGLDDLTTKFTKAGYINVRSLIEEGLTESLLDRLDIKAPLHRRILQSAINRPSIGQVQVGVLDVLEIGNTLLFDVVTSCGIWQTRRHISLQDFKSLRDSLRSALSEQSERSRERSFTDSLLSILSGGKDEEPLKKLKDVLIESFPEVEFQLNEQQENDDAVGQFNSNLKEEFQAYLKKAIDLLNTLQLNSEDNSSSFQRHVSIIVYDFLEIRDIIDSKGAPSSLFS